MVRSTEYGVRSGKHEEQSASRSSFLIPHSYFAVRTPTAIVTDLGTEFGVEVSEQGNTTSYVFRGKVAVQVTACDGKQGQALQLSENESACVEKTGADESLTLRRVAADPAAFVRHEQLATVAEESRLKLLRRWQAYNRQVDHDPALLAHYTFEPSKENTFVLSNRAAAGDALDGRIEGAEWVMGRFPGKFALRFLGPGSGGKVVLPEQERFAFAGPFSVAVWFKAEPFTAWWQAVITKGDVSWRLQRSTTTDKISFDTDFEPAGKDNHDVLTAQPDVADGQWHFAVAVYEPKGDAGRKRLYIDGRLEAETETPAPLRQNTDPVWIGAHCVHSGREFQGLIDEVAIFMRALSAEEVATMFKSGNVLGTGDVCP